MILSSLPLKCSVSYRNRTYNRVLGGPRYIHLTKETNAVFSGFSAFWAPAAMFMNPITCVMNCSCYYILILAFLQTLKSRCVSLNGLHLELPLRRRLLYPFNYENLYKIYAVCGKSTYSFFILSYFLKNIYTYSLYFILPCIHTMPLNRLPTCGSPTRSF